MAQLEYSSHITCGVLSSRETNPHETTTVGVWIRRTVDRPLPAGTVGLEANIPFGHQPLDPQKREIRVLIIRPGGAHEPLRTTLRTISLDKLDVAHQYEALSYTWGSLARTNFVDIDGFSYTITDNLAAALPRLRSEVEPRALWIDAICINQNDLEEKSVQVQLMSEIYASASRVVVWLGLSTADSVVGMDILREFAENKPFSSDATWRCLPSKMVVSGLKDIMNRDWFQRYWVVQEAALAREVIMFCGPHSISWSNTCISVSSFLRAVKSAAISPQWRETGLSSIDMDIFLGVLQMQLDTGPDASSWSRRQRKTDMLEYAYATRHRQASDIRDRIYSLIGLASGAGVQLKADYTKPAEEAFQTFADTVANETQELSDELRRLKGEVDVAAPEPSRTGTEMSDRTRNASHSLEEFIKSTCAQAIERVRNNEPWKAAQLLQEAATLLRSASYDTERPSAKSPA